MKCWRTTILLSLELALAAYGNQQPQKATSSSSHVKVAASSSKRKTGYKLAWNKAKAAKLAKFMTAFGATMQQTYTKVDRKTTAKWQGVALGEVFDSKKPLNVDDQEIPVVWLPKADQASRTKQNIVAVYEDDHAHVLYLFTLAGKGVPDVLVSRTAPKSRC